MQANEMVDGLVQGALKALDLFETYDQEQVDHIVKKASLAALSQHGELAELAVEETGRGIFEDKAVKNLFACEHVVNSMRGLKTAGVISRDELNGITEIAEPVGVICAMTPVTNPTSTTIFKALIALKTRNPIIFAFHPSAQNCSAEAARIVRDAAIEAGAPENCVQWIETPSMEATGFLMNHAGVSTILATGGNAMVKAAYSCGKPALGVGAGNVPAYVHKSAKLQRAIHDIVLSKAFDNGMICASEQAAILDKEIYKEGIAEFKRLGAYLVSAAEKTQLENFIFGTTAYGENCAGAKLNPNVVGKSPEWIAEQAGFSVPEGTSILIAECNEVGDNEPLTREKLSPVLAVLKAGSTELGVELAAQMVEFHGLGHSAAIHAEDEELVEEFGKRVKAIRVIANSPSTFGGIGDVYNAFLPSLTLGCGSYGHNSVSNNVTAVNLVNIKRIGRRNTNMQWFKVPPKIYFERNSIRYLGEMDGIKKVSLVTDKTMVALGFVEKVTNILQSRAGGVSIQVIDNVEPNPELDTVLAGAAMMRDFQPDTIVALGGGSAMDAAKIMWLMYEHPEIAFADTKEKFFDVRKRAFKFPSLGEKARMVAIPTTSGTGSEVTPFAVISDPKAAQKYPLADYALTPHVAIVDPNLPMGLPASVTADSGFDALTHATEAYISAYSNDYTDGLCLQAIKLIFENLEDCVKLGAKAPEAREKMHNASTVAGMAFANAFLGLVHAMAHTLGNTFHVPHGRTNALLLPHVIRHNGTVTHKATPWPKAEVYRAPERLQEIAKMLGLKARTPQEGVESYAAAVEELRTRCGIPSSFQEEGVDEAAFIAALPQQAMNAYADQCAPANPRMPMIGDMKQLMRQAYYGNREGAPKSA
ncbi:bifunctional acetaldehyde-CoA/alcohol dehydrogenase [Streptomyces sp. TRM66268-LWL]|uniref:Aldehyde-alcohol dehydrogenase n=1 Tax=Streptomyces polyasparticus TaxID=2767826 RepID=A0ABR7SK33_9ACTN|nr:bifunctional acetaldehyde-CoA/alcohol dehydrogenase [Streptomyces polyasparticus]MBC9715319.1 bifunctional acetaldehyde-CoA/alcohol dehydrogenase [Streptomyces polyasparticus]